MRVRGLEKSQKGHQPPPHTNTQTSRERKGEKKNAREEKMSQELKSCMLKPQSPEKKNDVFGIVLFRCFKSSVNYQDFIVRGHTTNYNC